MHYRGATLEEINREEEELNTALALSASLHDKKRKSKEAKGKSSSQVFLIPPQANPRQSAIYGKGQQPPPSPFMYRGPNTAMQMQRSAPPSYEVLRLDQLQTGSQSSNFTGSSEAPFNHDGRIVIINHPPAVWTMPYPNQQNFAFPNNSQAWVENRPQQVPAQKRPPKQSDQSGCCCLILIICIIFAIVAIAFVAAYFWLIEDDRIRRRHSNDPYDPYAPTPRYYEWTLPTGFPYN